MKATMTDWLIIPKDKYKLADGYELKFSNDYYYLCLESEIDSCYCGASQNEGIFIFGYILPRLETHYKNDPESLFNLYKEKGINFLQNFKGVFTMIILSKEDIIIATDQFGVSKFFYTIINNKIIAVNNFHKLKKIIDYNISLHNIYLYFLFNYFIGDTTLYKEIKKSKGAEIIKGGRKIEIKRYFDLYEFLRNRDIKYNRVTTFDYAPQFWRTLINQYLSYFGRSKIAQTLTAGLDSRMILAGFRSNGFNPDTFTFGNEKSMDVLYAKKIAKALNLRHSCIYPDKTFFENFENYAINTVYSGNGLVTLYRAHRFDAYKKLSQTIETVFFGFIGSEVIRGGVYPDGLIYPKFVLELWLNKDLNIRNYLANSFIMVEEKTIKEVEEIVRGYNFYMNPDTHIFEVIVPLHFGQDIRLLEKLNINSVAPFWDIDFLEFQKQTPFFVDNTRKKELSTMGHFKRRKGPYFSTKIVSVLDKDNAEISLGKGYSPRDYDLSPIYAGVKFYLHRLFNKKAYTTPNFSYGVWFKNFLKGYYSNNNLLFIKSKDEILSLINETKGHDELAFLSFVKNINVDLISKL